MGHVSARKTGTTPHPQLGQSHPFGKLDYFTSMLLTGMLILNGSDNAMQWESQSTQDRGIHSHATVEDSCRSFCHR